MRCAKNTTIVLALKKEFSGENQGKIFYFNSLQTQLNAIGKKKKLFNMYFQLI